MPPVSPLLRRRAWWHPRLLASRQPPPRVWLRRALRQPPLVWRQPPPRVWQLEQRVSRQASELAWRQVAQLAWRQAPPLVLRQVQPPPALRQVPLPAWPQGPWRRQEQVAPAVVSVEHLQPAGQEVLQPPVGAERQPREVSLPQGLLLVPPRVVPDLEVQPPSEPHWPR